MGTRPRQGSRGGWVALLGAICALGPAQGAAAAAPAVEALWASGVSARSASIHAELSTGAKSGTYRFEYIPRSTYEANLAAAKDGFDGALRSPVGEGSFAASSPALLARSIFGLSPATAYRYRLVAKNPDGQAMSDPGDFATHPASAPTLPDSRGWEMVSPVDKNGGEVSPPGALMGGALLQAAPGGSLVTYSSAASFGIGGAGAAPASQYIARRNSGGWSTENITAPALAGSYGAEPIGVPYRAFATDLGRGLMLSGAPCRGEGTGCPVPNPPLAGTDAPPGYQNHYLREGATGGFEALLGAGDLVSLDLDPAEFELAFAGASPDLRHVVLSSCSALTLGASEVPLGEGCDPAKPNLYRWSAGSLEPINAAPGAALAAPLGAVSADGQRIYFTDADGDLQLRDGAATKQVDAAAGGGGELQAATPDGAFALYLKDDHLHRYSTAADTSADLTPSGGVEGVLALSADGARAYYQDAGALRLWRQGTGTITVAPGADAAEEANFGPAGIAQASADGAVLAFVSEAPLTGYDNTDLIDGGPDSQVYLYEAAGAGILRCLSCNPTGARPIGPSTLPAVRANGTLSGSPLHKPRAISTDGRRVFFESEDALALADVNVDAGSGAGIADVYQWEAQGKGSCAKAGGCAALISSGTSDANESSSGFLEAGSRFLEASADGADAFFLTDVSLVGSDPGAIDLYDARVGGGFPEPTPPFPCDGDSCQVVPSEPQNPVLTTLLSGPGNSPERYRAYGAKARVRCPKGKRPKAIKRRGKTVRRCVAKAKAKRKPTRKAGRGRGGRR